jgi:type III secretion protein V
VPASVHIFAGVEKHLAPERIDQELTRLRRVMSLDLGVPFPGLVMRPVAHLEDGAYIIHINEIPVAEGRLQLGHLLVQAPRDVLDQAGIPWTPAQGALSGFGVWVEQRHAARLTQLALRTLTVEETLGRHLLHVFRRECDEFVGIQEAQLLVKRLAEENPDLERELQRTVPLPRLTEVLRRLVREEISIRNLRAIAHGLIDWAPREKDTVMLTEYVRTCLSKYISFRFSNGNNTLPALVLHPALEEQLRKNIRQTAAGTMLMLDPETTRQLSRQISQAAAAYTNPEGVSSAVLLTSLELRPYIRKLTELELRHVPVLSYQELEPSLQVTPLASVSL